MVRPLEYLSGNLESMSDADLERLTYNLRAAFASVMNASASNFGNISVGVGPPFSTIGSASDTSSTQQTATTVRIVNDGIIQTYPAYPGLGTETDTSYTYGQNRFTSGISFPSSSTLNSDGYVYYDNVTGSIQPASTASHLYDEVLLQCITEMRTGDEVGTFRISTSTPTDGGSGTWVDKGTWFTDTTYSAGSTTYKYWLKTALDTPPGTEILPVGLDGSDLKERAIDGSDLISNVLLPALRLRVDNGDLHYTVVSSTPSGVNRGAFTDTRQTTASNTQSFSNPNYNSTSTPTGSATVQTTYYLNLA